MIIHSEQEMLAFGENFAEKLRDNWNGAFRDRPRLTRSGMSEVPPVTTGGHERVEESTFQLPLTIELIGDVGAGKTTFVRGLAKGLGINEPITSPSFTISKQYITPDNKRLIHYDFYRLSDPGLMSEDLTESINDPDTITVIEWSDSVRGLLPKKHILINIIYNDDDTRSIKPTFCEH